MFREIMNISAEYKPILRNAAVIKITVAGLISKIGNQIGYFAMLKKVYDISGGQITDLGFLSVVKCIPFLLFSRFAGTVIDRASRKKILIICDILSAIIVIGLIFTDSIHGIYILAFLSSTVFVFFEPARKAFEPNLVREEEIPLMNSFTSSVSSLDMIIASASGAAIVAFFGVTRAFSADAMTFIISAVILSRINVQENHVAVPNVENDNASSTSFREGLSAVLKNNRLKMMLMLDLYATFAMAMQGILIYSYLKIDLALGNQAELAWGTLLSCIGIGVIAGSTVIGPLLKRSTSWFKLYLNVLLMDGIGLLMFVAFPWFPLSMMIFITLGFAGAAHSIIFNSIIQQSVSDENRGKIFSFFYMLSSPIAIISITTGTWAATVVTAGTVLMASALIEIILAAAIRLSGTYKEAQIVKDSKVKGSAELEAVA